MEARAEPNGTLHGTATVLASLVIPAPLLVGRVIEAIMDSTNPAGLTDLSAGLAYLTEILVGAFSAAILVAVGFVVLTTILWVRSRSFRAVALPVVVFVVQLVAAAVILGANAAIDAAQGS